jgi:hypothetical protein
MGWGLIGLGTARAERFTKEFSGPRAQLLGDLLSFCNNGLDRLLCPILSARVPDKEASSRRQEGTEAGEPWRQRSSRLLLPCGWAGAGSRPARERAFCHNHRGAGGGVASLPRVSEGPAGWRWRGGTSFCRGSCLLSRSSSRCQVEGLWDASASAATGLISLLLSSKFVSLLWCGGRCGHV